MSSYLLPVIAFSSGILLGGAGVSLTKSSEKQQPTAIPQQPQQPSSPSLGKVEGSLVDSGVGSLKAGSILGPGGFPGESYLNNLKTISRSLEGDGVR